LIDNQIKGASMYYFYKDAHDNFFASTYPRVADKLQAQYLGHDYAKHLPSAFARCMNDQHIPARFVGEREIVGVLPARIARTNCVWQIAVTVIQQPAMIYGGVIWSI
jgi:hypothetical protein